MTWKDFVGLKDMSKSFSLADSVSVCRCIVLFKVLSDEK